VNEAMTATEPVAANAPAAVDAPAPETGWILDRRFDLFFFFFSGLVGAAAGALCLAVPALVIPLWWAWLLLLDGPHLVATFTRTYLDPDERRQRGRLFAWSLLAFAPGVAAWIAARATGARGPIDAYLLIATLWSWHHQIRQDYGIMSIYQRHARTPPRARRLDWWFLHGTLWAAFGLFLVVHPANRAVMGLPVELPAWGRIASIAAGVALAGLTLGYAAIRIAGARRDPIGMRPVIFLLGPAIALHAFALFVIGAFEPLVPRPTNPEQVFMTTAIVGGIVHGMQYLGIVFAVNRRRHAAAAGGPAASLVSALGRRPLVAYVAFVAVAIVYLAINAARAAAPPVSLFAEGSAGAQLFLVLYWGLFFHHFYLDQKIWRPHLDRRLQFELGLRSQA
jgi:hypothetical protein